MSPATWVPFVCYWRQRCWPLRGIIIFHSVSLDGNRVFMPLIRESLCPLSRAMLINRAEVNAWNRHVKDSSLEWRTHGRNAVPPLSVWTRGSFCLQSALNCFLWSGLRTAAGKHCIISEMPITSLLNAYLTRNTLFNKEAFSFQGRWPISYSKLKLWNNQQTHLDCSRLNTIWSPCDQTKSFSQFLKTSKNNVCNGGLCRKTF